MDRAMPCGSLIASRLYRMFPVSADTYCIKPSVNSHTATTHVSTSPIEFCEKISVSFAPFVHSRCLCTRFSPRILRADTIALETIRRVKSLARVLSWPTEPKRKRTVSMHLQFFKLSTHSMPSNETEAELRQGTNKKQ